MKQLFVVMVSLAFYAHGYCQQFYVFVGSYNTNKNNDGLYVYLLDTSSGSLTKISSVNNVLNPSFITLLPKGNLLYACTDTRTVGAGSVTSFIFNPLQGRVAPVDNKKSGGDNPVYVSTNPTGKWVIAANYSGGSAAVFKVDANGGVSDAAQVITYTDSSINKNRQEKSHVHSAVFSPNGKYAFFPDLGADKIRIYRFKANSKTPLQPANPAFVQTTPGSGPRHLIFNKAGNIAWCIEEMAGAICTYRFARAKLTLLQRVMTHPATVTGDHKSADLHLSPDERFLYATNREDENNIAIFSVAKNGQLTNIGYHPTSGLHPRNFAIDPTGNFLIVANQNTGNLVVLRRNKITGLLQNTGVEVRVDSPSCVKIREY